MSARKKILLIVDDWEALERYEEQLEEYFDVVTAPFGSEGLRAARGDRPDHIVVNLAFENMTSLEAIHALRQDIMTARIPILCLAETVSEAGIFPTLQGDLCLLRPFTPEDLVKALS